MELCYLPEQFSFLCSSLDYLHDYGPLGLVALITLMHSMLFFASSSPSQPTPECVQTAGVQGTNQAQAITNRCCLLRVPGQSKCSQTHQRKETAEFWPYMDLINRMRTDAEAGTSEMGEDTLLTIWWSDSIGVFFKEFRRGNTKGSRFLWRLVGFSRRSRIFPRNPTLGFDFPTTLEMGCVLRCPSPSAI